MNPVPLRTLKKGELFTRKDIPHPKESQVFTRGEYDRESRKYECGRWSDVSDAIYLKGETLVYTEFTF